MLFETHFKLNLSLAVLIVVHFEALEVMTIITRKSSKRIKTFFEEVKTKITLKSSKRNETFVDVLFQV